MCKVRPPRCLSIAGIDTVYVVIGVTAAGHRRRLHIVYIAASIEKEDVALSIFPACVEIVALDLVLSLVWIGAPRTDRTQNDTLRSRWR